MCKPKTQLSNWFSKTHSWHCSVIASIGSGVQDDWFCILTTHLLATQPWASNNYSFLGNADENNTKL